MQPVQIERYYRKYNRLVIKESLFEQAIKESDAVKAKCEELKTWLGKAIMWADSLERRGDPDHSEHHGRIIGMTDCMMIAKSDTGYRECFAFVDIATQQAIVRLD